MLAILSDIHSNLEALNAVMADANARGAERFCCLGDTLGLGPDPSECTEIVQSFDFCLSGNWDYFICGNGDPKLVRDNSNRGFWYDWVRAEISVSQLDFYATRPSVFRQDEAIFAHGDPTDSINGYLFPESVFDALYMERVFNNFDGLYVCGHSHVPGVFDARGFHDAHQFDGKFKVKDQMLVNVGSVGMPRDEDRRACYLLFDGEFLEFVRVTFDAKLTQQKIHDLGPPG